jgi:hypothetical protein
MRLLELGSMRQLGDLPANISPVIQLFSMVNTVEDPYAATGAKPPNAQAAVVAERLRTIALARRREIHGHRGMNLSGIDGLGAELAHLRGILSASAHELTEIEESEEVYDHSLGKSFFKKLKKYALPSPKLLAASTKSVAHKTLKVVKSPAFLAVAGIVVNIIPGIGQVASGLLLAASMAAIASAGYARNAYAAKVEQGKAEKRQDEAQKAADAQTDEELKKFYAEYAEDYFVPNGYTQQVWDGLTREQRIQLATALSKGTLQPYKPVNEDEAIAQAYAANKAQLNTLGYTDAVWAALPKTDKLQILQAYSQNNLRPYQTPQAAVDVVATAQATSIANGGDGSHPFPNVPPDVQAKADAATPALVNQIHAVGVDNYNATAAKAVGQAGAMGAMFDGAGANMPGSTGDVSRVINDNANSTVKAAIGQAKDDLLNTASAFGEEGAVQAALDKGTPSSVPWTPIIIGGSIVTTGLGLYLALSRKRG